MPSDRPDPSSVAELIHQLAVDAIRTQEGLDRDWAGSPADDSSAHTPKRGQQRQFFEATLAALPGNARDQLAAYPELRALLASLAPSRLAVTTWETSCRVLLRRDRERAWGLYAQPVTALWERRYGSATTQTSSLSLVVEAVPLPAAAAAAGDPDSAGY